MARAKSKLTGGTYKENCEKFKDDNKLEFGELVLESQDNPGDGPIKIKCGDGVHDYEDLPYTAGSDEDQNQVMRRLATECYELKQSLRSVICFTFIVGIVLVIAMGAMAFLGFHYFGKYNKTINEVREEMNIDSSEDKSKDEEVEEPEATEEPQETEEQESEEEEGSEEDYSEEEDEE